MSNLDPNIVPAAPVPTPAKMTVGSVLKSVLDYLRQPEKSHAIAVLLGGLAAKSAYTKAAVAAVMILLGVQ